ncbi:uncharacterized protein LOC131329517 isoform X4 [Rhododendron vialii]|uniref:uncharacterized protein LOC131329517 isoform X4 n=1 Tax=Rhododendron vialii TaxID=182163 RepID=UPI00265F7783|nr:uncharacterized protein LOC131329517 isoform X4 [Rhododendron vialii]
MSRVSPKVDIIDMLQKASVPNFATDGSAAKQIKELSAEVTKLKWLREERRSSRFQSNLFLVPLGKIRLMVLQQWYPQMELAKVGLSKVPLWIQIFNIPLEYWNGPGLSYIASAVGKPLYANEVSVETFSLQ